MFPPGPSTSQQDQFQRYYSDVFGYLSECHQQFGDIFTLDIGTFGIEQPEANGKWVFLAHPDYLKTHFTAPANVIAGGEGNCVQFLNLPPVRSSTAIDGQEHAIRRKMLNKPFQKVEQHFDMLMSCTKKWLNTLPKNQTVPMLPETKKLLEDVVFRLVFGQSNHNNIKIACADLIMVEDPSTTIPEKRQLLQKIEQLLLDVIQQQRAQKPTHIDVDTGGLFSYLLSTVDGNGKHLSDCAVAHEATGLLSGGVGVTAIMLCWSTLWMLKNPEQHSRLLKEQKHVLGSSELTQSILGQLPCMDAFIKESLRLTPFMGTPASRLLKADLQVGDYLLPKGTMVVGCAYLVHQQPEIYPEPEKFDLERFLDAKPNPYEWLPFGGGRRRCVGFVLAQYIMKIVLTLLLQRYQLTLKQADVIPEMQGAFFAPKGGSPLLTFSEIE